MCLGVNGELNYSMNKEGSLIAVHRVYSVLEESLNPAFLSCPLDDQNGGVHVDFWFWILNTNNQNQIKITPPTVMTKTTPAEIMKRIQCIH